MADEIAALQTALARVSNRCSARLRAGNLPPLQETALGALLGTVDCTLGLLADADLADLVRQPVPPAAPPTAADRDFDDLQPIACGPLLRDQQSRLFHLLARTDWTDAEIGAWLRSTYEVSRLYALNAAQAARAIADLEAQFAAPATA